MINTASILQGLIKEALPLAAHYIKDGETDLASIEDIVSEKYEENYILVCVLYKLVHKDHDKQDEGGNPYSKKQKKGYNRIYQFGDGTGQTCCVMCENQENARTFMNLMVDVPAVGQCFVLIEPTAKIGQALRQDMPVLDVSTTFLPLKDEFMQLFPTVVPKPPTLANETTFFILHGVKLRWVQTELRGKGDVQPASCPSFLCDRQEPLRINHACGCFSHSTKGNFSPVVLEGTIISDDSKNEENKRFSVKNDRSYRTTCMFITRPDSIGILQKLDRLKLTTDLRASVKKCYEYINGHGGFTLCGTITRGEVQDASDENVMVASEKITYHVCYSQPTQLKLLHDIGYRKLKFIYSPPSVTGLAAAPVNAS